mmetsp:Transcript_5618/g.23352  ORF Transcript_5618/g.23352 Transcript_5618/m.23352 type:complete len:138 (-) Transcript_5618:398-811(-)
MEPPGPRSVGCAKCCAVFSSTGVVFLCIIGTLLQKQSVFILGIEHPATAASQCFGAAALYVTCIVISLGVLAYDKIAPRSAVGGGPYNSMSNGDSFSQLPVGLTESQNRLLRSLDERAASAGMAVEMTSHQGGRAML